MQPLEIAWQCITLKQLEADIYSWKHIQLFEQLFRKTADPNSKIFKG